jgi:chromate transporter
VQFVGFLAAYRFPDMSSPIVSAIVGSILTTWVTYAPCFLWIFTLAPYIEYIRGRLVFTEALQAITAAVVGVILNLSVWFALKALFKTSAAVKSSIFDFEYPVLTSIDWYASGICLVALFLQFHFKKSMFFILGTSATLGVIAFLLKP